MKWITRIRKALKRKKFTEQDKDLAQSWNTCAVGELDVIVNWELQLLGSNFYHAVKQDKTRAALIIYNKIQKTEILKNEI